MVAHINGKLPLQREVKLWGSEADVYFGRPNWRERFMCRAFNRTLLPSFQMDDMTQYQYVGTINDVRPVMIWTYVDSIYMLAKKINRQGLTVHQPKVIMTTAGTLHEFARAEIQAAFPESRIVNQYGCREVSCIAVQTPSSGRSLWVLNHTNVVELVDAAGKTITETGVAGRVLVTNLINRAMPLIRYDTGDMAEAAEFANGQVTHLRTVLGRVNSHLIGRGGRAVHGEYITHLFYGADWCRRFRVTQETPSSIVVAYESVVVATASERERIEYGMRKVMDDQTQIRWERLDVIPTTPSGKYEFVRRSF